MLSKHNHAFLFAMASCVLGCYAGPALPGPNVLFIVVDDLNPTLSTYGHNVVTPGIERLAATATQFDRAYVSVAVCAPSRTAFLTGLRPDTTQVWTIGPYFRNVSRGQGMALQTLPQLFRANGYK